MNKVKENMQTKWSAVQGRFGELRTDFNAAIIVISHNPVARILVIAFAALAVILAILWAGEVWASGQNTPQTNSVNASAADNSQQLRTLMYNQSRLQSQNATLKNKVENLSSATGKLERQNGDLSKKFNALSKPS